MTERVALVTGTSSGIGEGICQCLLENGFRVVGLQRSLPRFRHERLSTVQVNLADRAAMEATANEIGLAGMQAAGIKAGMGTMAKAYGAGKAAESGLVSAVLAEKGFTGPRSVIEGLDGFLQTFGDGANGDRIVESFGKPYHFIAPGIGNRKPRRRGATCCRNTGRALRSS